MEKLRFVIIVNEVKGIKLENPIVRIEFHLYDEIEEVYNSIVDELDLYESDEVIILPENPNNKTNNLCNEKEIIHEILNPYERTRNAVYATGNKWAIENFHATHD